MTNQELPMLLRLHSSGNNVIEDCPPHQFIHSYLFTHWGSLLEHIYSSPMIGQYRVRLSRGRRRGHWLDLHFKLTLPLHGHSCLVSLFQLIFEEDTLFISLVEATDIFIQLAGFSRFDQADHKVLKDDPAPPKKALSPQSCPVLHSQQCLW